MMQTETANENAAGLRRICAVYFSSFNYLPGKANQNPSVKASVLTIIATLLRIVY